MPILPFDGIVTLNENFLDNSGAKALFARLRVETAWRQEPIRVQGQAVRLPRLTAWYGDPGATYTYSGIPNRPLPWTAPLAALRERLRDETGVSFNSVLLNRYRSGQDSISWHADDEAELGNEPIIASLSLGATRTFHFRHKDDHRRTVRLPLVSGSLLIMAGSTQQHWEHRVPKEPHAGERLNLTFRCVQ